MNGQVTVKLPVNKHLLIKLSSSGVSGPGTLWQCFLCDKKADYADRFDQLPCIPERIITIKVGED